MRILILIEKCLLRLSFQLVAYGISREYNQSILHDTLRFIRIFKMLYMVTCQLFSSPSYAGKASATLFSFLWVVHLKRHLFTFLPVTWLERETWQTLVSSIFNQTKSQNFRISLLKFKKFKKDPPTPKVQLFLAGSLVQNGYWRQRAGIEEGYVHQSTNQQFGMKYLYIIRWNETL